MTAQWFKWTRLLLALSMILPFSPGAALANPAVVQSTSVNLELTAAVGGATKAVAGQGSYAYYGSGASLVIADITDLAHPVQIGQSELVGGVIQGLAASGSYVYLAAGDGGLVVEDASNPSNPFSLAVRTEIGWARDVLVIGDQLYLFGNGLLIYNITNPVDPVLVGEFVSEGLNFSGGAVVGSYIYLNGSRMDGSDSGVYVADISDLQNPVQAAYVPMESAEAGIAAEGSHLYAIQWCRGMHIFDISSPTQPVEQSFYNTPGCAWDVSVANNRAYIADWGGGLRIVDVSNPFNPLEIDAVDTPTMADEVALNGNAAFVADWEAGLVVVRLDQPGGAYLASTQGTFGQVVDVAVDGSYAYVAGFWDGGLTILDVRNPSQPLEVGWIQPNSTVYSVDVSGGFAYVGTTDWLTALVVVDARDPAHPREVGSINLPGGVMRVVVQEPYAYVALGTEGVAIIDISDPTQPSLAAAWDTPGEAVELAVEGSLLAVADTAGGLQVYDISNLGNPDQLGALTFDSDALGVAVAGDTAYVGTKWSGLQVVSLSNPANMEVIGSCAGLDSAGRVVLVGDIAFVGQNRYGVQAVDVSDPQSPLQVAHFDSPGELMGFTATGSHVYLAGRENGVVIVHSSFDPAYTISGQVTDQTGSPVVGAMVYAGADISALSDSAGMYEIAGLPQGSYSLSATKFGYTFDPAAQTIILPPSAAPINFTGQPVLSNVSGRALGLNGEPLVGALITSGAGSSVFSDATGHFTFEGLPLGTYSLSASWNGSLLSPSNYDIFVPPGTSGKTFTLPVDLMLANQVGGASSSMVVAGSLAFTQFGPRLGVINLADPAKPVLVGVSEPLPAAIDDLAVQGGYAYVLAAGDLYIFSAADPARLQTVNLIDLDANRLIVSSSRLVAAGSSLWTFSLADPTTPSLSGVLPLSEVCTGLAVAGNWAIVAQQSTGLRFIDLLDPAHPQEKAALGLPAGAMDVAAANGYAYVAVGQGKGLFVVNMIDPLHPQVVGFLSSPENDASLSLAGNWVLYGASQSGLRIMDVSDPANPIQLGVFDSPGSANRAALYGSLAILADWTGGVRVVDISHPANPLEVGSFITRAADPIDLALAGRYAYVLNNSGVQALQVFDVADPANPVFMAGLDIPGEGLGLDVQDTHLYLAADDAGMLVVDVSDPAHPVLAGSLDTAGRTQEVFVDGHLAYLADGQAGMLVVDILDPAHPVQLGSAAGAGYTWNIAAAGAYAYTVGEVGFQVYDVSDPANPLIAANAPSATLWSRALALGLHTAYVSGWDGILRAIDISNPLSPVQVGTWSMPESITRVSLSGNVAWVAGDTGGLWAVNTADPTNLVEAATYNTAGQVYAMEAGCGMVMAADRSGGLVSFTTSQCAESAPRQALPLELGQASAGMVPLQGYADFRVNVPAGKSLRVKVAPGASADSLELYSRYAALPDWTHYDQVSFTPQADGSYAILISPTQAGDTYLSVYGRVLPAGGSFTILVEEIQYDLVSLTPTSAANSGKISLSLAGLGFEPGMTVELKLGTTVRQASSISLVSPRELWAEVDLLGLAPGTYDVVIRWSGGETRSLLSAFSVTAAEIGSLLEAELVAPEQVRPGRSYTLWLYYRNIGDVEMDAPIFILDGPDGVDMRLYASDPFTTGTLHVLGAGSSGPAGKLSPGESGSIPIFYQVPLDATAHELFNFQLSWMLRDDTEIDWESWESEVRPPDVNPEAWAVTWSHFQQQVGTSWRDFSRVLSEQASYLGQYGGRTIKVDDLFGALLNHAGAASLLAVLDEHRDAYFAARGLPLEFTRQAFSKLDARFSVGPLGRNWSHNYEYHLASPEAGVQSVYGPGGSQRKFYQAVNGTWQAAPGDHGRLEAQANGSFLLTEPDGLRWLFNTAGQLAWLEDANLNRITFTYDGNNRLVEAKHSNGQKLSLSYYTTGASTGRLYRLVDHAGQTTEYIYDASGEHLIQVLAPGSVVTSYTYVPAVGSPSDHALASVTDAGGVNHYFSYDSYGRLASHWLDGEAEREDFTYDSYGSIFVEDALGEVTVLRMNAADLPLHISDAEGRTWQFRYNVQGQPLMQVSPGGGQVRLAYDGMGNFSQYEDPLGGLTLFSYTSDFNRLAMLRDAIGNRLEYHYDENGNLTAQEYPDGSQELYGYDANGNLTANTNRRGQTITFKYNSLGQRTRTSYPDGRTIDYSYNTYGKLLSAADSVSGTITLQWDARGYLTRIDYPGGRWFQYTYDNAGRCTRRTGQDGYIVNYAYDPAGRLRELTDASNARLVLYSYDAKGRLLSEDRGNGTRSVYTYNTAGDLLNLVHYAPGGAEQASFEYTYTADGLRASETSSAGLTSYAYDAAGKLVSVSLPDGSSASYTYDANGNRLRAETDDSLQLHALNTLNQYTLVGDVLFSYDADGNLVSENGSAGITTYTYDAANRLVNVSEPGGDTWEYTYDALGNRSGASHNGAVSTWVFEPSNLTGMDTLPSPAIEYEAGGTLAGRYIYGLGLTARLDGSGQASYYAYNATGHTALLTNSVGTVANSYRYDPFGEETNVVGSLPNPFRYAGRYGVIDRGSSLLDMRARFYLPSLGRFTSADPAATPPWNLYTYANNDPVDQVDPSGLSALVPGGESPDALGLLLGKLKGWFDRANNPNYHVETPVSHCGVRGRGVDASLLDECPSDDSEAITSDDPNEKAGPVGIGVNHIVGRSDTLAYTIYFENVATAAAPAQEVFITDVLDPLLDWSTFQVGEIAFGDQSAVASALGQPGQFYARLTIPDYRPDVTKTWWVDITVKLDNQTGQARWTLRMLDPTTGELPEDVLAGFLPPNDDTGRGQGLVTFTIKPREDAAFSSVITNQAIIIFDQNAPILTNQVINTIGLPHGLMLPLILR